MLIFITVLFMLTTERTMPPLACTSLSRMPAGLLEERWAEGAGTWGERGDAGAVGGALGRGGRHLGGESGGRGGRRGCWWSAGQRAQAPGGGEGEEEGGRRGRRLGLYRYIVQPPFFPSIPPSPFLPPPPPPFLPAPIPLPSPPPSIPHPPHTCVRSSKMVAA